MLMKSLRAHFCYVLYTQITHHNHCRTFLLPHHLPEIFESFNFGPLSSNPHFVLVVSLNYKAAKVKQILMRINTLFNFSLVFSKGMREQQQKDLTTILHRSPSPAVQNPKRLHQRSSIKQFCSRPCD